jgi:ribonuclease J
MLELVRPRAFVPLHGTLHHLHRHAELAREVGVDAALVLEDGEVAELSRGAIAKVDRVKTGRVHTWGGQPIAPTVLRERRALASEGVASVVLEVRRGAVVARVATRGVLDEERDRRTLAQAEREASDAFEAARDREPAQVADLVRQAVRRVFFRALGIKPTTLVTIVADSRP